MTGKLVVICTQKGLVKTGVDLYIDKKKYHLKPQEEPYEIAIEPGEHKLKFKDPAGVAKKIGGGVVGGVGAATAGAIGLAAGVVSGRGRDMAAGATGGAAAGKRMAGSLGQKMFGESGTIKGAYDLTIGDNETIKLLCVKDKVNGISVSVI